MKGSGDLATSYLKAADILVMSAPRNDECVKRAAYMAAERFRARGNAILNGEQTRGPASPHTCAVE